MHSGRCARAGVEKGSAGDGIPVVTDVGHARRQPECFKNVTEAEFLRSSERRGGHLRCCFKYIHLKVY